MKKYLPGNNSILDDFKPFAVVDFIVTDIDGTLIGKSESIFMQIKKKIKRLRKKNVQLTVATGRTYFGTKKLLEDLAIKKGMPVTLYNGGIVLEYGTDKIVHSEYLLPTSVHKLLCRLPLDRISIYAYTFQREDNIWKQEDEPIFVETVYGIGVKNKEYDSNGAKIHWVNLIEIPEAFIVSVLIEEKSLTEQEKTEISDFLKLDLNCSVTNSGNGFIEIKASGLGKGVIFEVLRQQEQYKGNCFLAVGDNDNDKELFQSANISIAVGNASSMAIEEAQYICEKESAIGFIDILDVIYNAKKYIEN